MNVTPSERGTHAPKSQPFYRAEADGETGPVGYGRVSPVVQIIAILRKRKWVIIAAVTAAMAIGLVATILATPQYTATATLEIQREKQNFTNVEGADSSERMPIDPEYYQTQYGLLQSKSLAERVATGLKLHDSPKFFETFKSPLAEKWWPEGKLDPKVTREQRIRAAGGILLANINVKPERLSRLVEVSFTSPDRFLSKRIVDAWGVNFIQATLDRRFETTAHARRFLEGRLSQLRERIDQAERQLVDYASNQGIVNVPGPATGEGSPAERPLVADDLSTLNRELAQATADRIQAQSRLSTAGGSATESLQNQAIATMRASRADLAAQRAKMLRQFEPQYPPAQALQDQIQQLDRSIAAEESRVRSSLNDTYKSSLQREQRLTARVEELKGSVLDLRKRSIQYNIFQREVDTNRQLYDALLQRYKEIGVAGGVGVNNIAVVDSADVPSAPSSPNLMLNMLMAMIAGLLLGGAGALLLEQLNDGIDDPAAVPDALGVPLIGTVPKLVDDHPLDALSDPKTSLSEAYTSLQTSLSFATDHGFPRTLAVTSSRPAEGKSLTSYALAQSLARTARRVIVVDADMRSPSIHQILGVSANAGLSNYLSGSDTLTDLIHPTPREGLFALLAGPQPPSAADLLAGGRLEMLIAELSQQFDHIVFDAPPVMGLADAPLIGSRVEGTVFVVEAHATGKSVARSAISRLKAANVRMLGAVVTKFDTKRAHYSYGYDYGYGYGYGDDADAKSA